MTTTSSLPEAEQAEKVPSGRRVLMRQVLPLDQDLDVLPLYVDTEAARLDADKYEIGSNRNAKAMNSAALRQSTSTGDSIHPDQIVDRHTVRLAGNDKVSFGTYFNAFPAGYWRRWTVVAEVRLTVRLRGRGASVTVYKSMANGRSQRVDQAGMGEQTEGTFTFDLTLKPFADGGWYWYDVVAGDEEVEVTAEWDAEVPADRLDAGRLTICITTMNRPDFCSKLLTQIGSDNDVQALLDEVLVMEQGTKLVVEDEHFPAARDALGAKLRVIEQGNLGGSGGYARGQLEVVRKGAATYAMMMDDDVVCEPESIIRAVTFADLARRPTIVGGHMFSLYSRSRLHSYGEIVQPWRWWWQSPPSVYTDWDFGARNIRSSRWLHQRVDVDFNGWFMCLIPTQVLAEIGLSLPLFIKWDDSEFGIRAKEAGYPTVSFPGAAVWHVPWTDKNDALDWQAYFHHRNRLIAALLHSPYPRGGRMVRESLNQTVMHLIAMQYATVELRLRAMEDVFAGPERLHEELPTKLAEVNAVRKRFPDNQLEADPDAFPPVRRHKPPKRGKDGREVPGRLSQLVTAGIAPLRHLTAARSLSREHPEAELPAMDAKWYRIAKFDSALVSMPDGTSAAFYQRDPELYRSLAARTATLHRRLLQEWPELAERYRASLGTITSPEAWEETFRPWAGGDEGTSDE